MEEHEVPIDQIGGTSIGAFVSGLYAREGDLLSSVGRAKQFSSRMGNVWRMLSDVTYPIVAYTTVRLSHASLICFSDLCSLVNQGHEFNRAIYKVCGYILGYYHRATDFENLPSLSTIFISRTCGCRSSAILPTFSHRKMRSTARVMHGVIFVCSFHVFPLP